LGKRRSRRRRKQEVREEKGGFPLVPVLLFVALAAGALGYMLYAKGSESGGEAGGEILITPPEYDFGRVSVAGGEVSADLKIKNIGDEPLVLSYIDSSCGCTTASVVYGGREGPRFTMREHGTNPENWRLRIPPGEEAVLRVYYNPRVHPDLRGEVSRYIEVYSSDPEKPVVRVWVRVFQVD